MRLWPDQLKAMWDVIRYGVARSIPPHVKASGETMRRILESLLADRAQCWVVYLEDEGGQKLMHSMLISAMERERVTDTKFLNLWAMYAYRPSDMSGWERMRETVEAFAREQGCQVITALSTNPKAVELALNLGASQVAFLTKEV